MCGICGEYNFSGNHVDPSAITRMSNALIPRGPDDYGIYCNGPIGLGHRRLSIIDLSPSGKQPMWSYDKSMCIVFNGEVYNFKEIKKELQEKGYAFTSNTDTEVVVNAIHCWGIERALSRFIGMFAFAVWDNRDKILTLCRDRAGIKPLYYYVDHKRIFFGSEIKSLLAHPNFKRQLKPAALGQYFVTGFFLRENTVFENTFKLPPGHFLSITSNGVTRLNKYWGIDTIERGSFKGSFEDASYQLEQLLESAFRYRLISDVPVGLFLSGGVDSSLVSAILKKKINADILNITIGFHDKNYDETPNAKIVSEELGVKHIVHYVNVREAQDVLLKFCDIYDEPFGDTSGIPTYILAKTAREHVKVALSADGGDEQFCGYSSYKSYVDNFRSIKKVPWQARFIVSKILERIVPYRQVLSWKLHRSDEVLYYPQSIARFEKMLRLLKVSSEKGLIPLMNEVAWSANTIKELLPAVSGDIFKETVLSGEYLASYKDGIIDGMMKTDFSAFLPDDILVKVDRASMSVSLECRDPFLDHRITEFAYSLPVSYLFYKGEQKRILKSILRKWIKEDVVSSAKKGFVIPLYYWLKGVWKPIVLEYLSRERVKAIGFLDAEKVENEVNRFYKYHGYRAEKIWMMLNFQMWAERWYIR